MVQFDLADRIGRLSKYWDMLDQYNRPKLDVDCGRGAAAAGADATVSACQYRMVSDVPVGVFLSGGYDSATVAATLQRNSDDPIRTFTIGFEDDDFNEAPHLPNRIAEFLGTDHTERICTTAEAQQIIPQLATWYDEPFGDLSAIPTSLVSRVAREHVKVACPRMRVMNCLGATTIMNVRCRSFDLANTIPGLAATSRAVGCFGPYPVA